MDKLKGAVGLGGKDQEGQEPVSGAKGEGTAPEPFDAGNKQEATQAADSSEFDSEHAYLGSAIDADEARAADESKSEPNNTTTNSAAPADHKDEEQPASKKDEKKSGGGSKEKEEEEAKAGTQEEEEEKAEREKHLPPNHLGSAVPEGASTDLADRGIVAPGQTDGLAAQKTASPSSPTTNQDSPSTSASGKQPDRSTSVGSSSNLSPDRSRSAGSGAQLLGSRGEHRGSMIPSDAPKYKRVENPDRIPVAGGKRIGEEQYQTRRASMAPPSPPADMKKLDREGSPDPVTARNTESNTHPQSMGAVAEEGGPTEAKNTAPQQMKEFSMGGASEKAEEKPSAAGAGEDVAPDQGPGGETVRSASVEKEKGGLSPGGSGSGSGGGHARRGSVFDKIKQKMKGSNKS